MPAAAFCFKVPPLPLLTAPNLFGFAPHSVIAAIHPAVRLLLFLVAALAAQVLAPWACVAGLALVALCPGAARRAWILARRARFLLLSLFLIFALGTPGTPLFSAGDWLTHEGVALGLEHGLRLLAVLGAVAWLLASTPPAELAAGCYTLLAPLARLGLHPERAVARLLLVLHYGETPATPGAWRRLLVDSDGPAAAEAGEAVSLRLYSLGLADAAVAMLAVSLLFTAWWLD